MGTDSELLHWQKNQILNEIENSINPKDIFAIENPINERFVKSTERNCEPNRTPFHLKNWLLIFLFENIDYGKES